MAKDVYDSMMEAGTAINQAMREYAASVIAGTLRQMSGWGDQTPADMQQLAKEIESWAKNENGKWDDLCCPMCQEITCDSGCALEELRT